MRGVSEEDVRAAREMDLLTYLQMCEPWELKQTSSNEYRTVSHGSLVISNGKWYWNRGGFGGVSALDYLIKVRGMGFVAAVETVCGVRAPVMPASLPVKETGRQRKDKALSLPQRVKYATKMLAYLQERGINAAVIQRCIDAGILYEGRHNGEAVCVFIGMDAAGKARFGSMRGISSDLKRDCAGSDKRCGFRLAANDSACDTLAVFEAPVDALSCAALFPQQDCHRLSLGGTTPVALLSFLEDHPRIRRVSLCLDADDAGGAAAGRIRSLLAEDERFAHITVTIDPPAVGKDYNDMLLHTKRTEREQHAGRRKEAGLSI